MKESNIEKQILITKWVISAIMMEDGKMDWIKAYVTVILEPMVVDILRQRFGDLLFGNDSSIRIFITNREVILDMNL